MILTISDEICNATHMTEQEVKLELAIILYQKKNLQQYKLVILLIWELFNFKTLLQVEICLLTLILVT